MTTPPPVSHGSNLACQPTILPRTLKSPNQFRDNLCPCCLILNRFWDTARRLGVNLSLCMRAKINFLSETDLRSEKRRYSDRLLMSQVLFTFISTVNVLRNICLGAIFKALRDSRCSVQIRWRHALGYVRGCTDGELGSVYGVASSERGMSRCETEYQTALLMRILGKVASCNVFHRIRIVPSCRAVSGAWP